MRAPGLGAAASAAARLANVVAALGIYVSANTRILSRFVPKVTLCALSTAPPKLPESRRAHL